MGNVAFLQANSSTHRNYVLEKDIGFIKISAKNRIIINKTSGNGFTVDQKMIGVVP